MKKTAPDPVKETPPGAAPNDRALTLKTHDELVAQVPEIFRRLNANPEIGRLLLVNPILALEDLNVKLSDDLKDHLKRTIGFPKGRVEQIARVRKKLRAQLGELAKGGPAIPIPKTPKERADLVFTRLGVVHGGKRPETLTVEELKGYVGRHPIVATLFELGVLERGAIIFNTKGAYEAHKQGRPHHPWLKRLHFRT